QHAFHAAVTAVRVERRHDLHTRLLRRRTDLHYARAVVGQPARRARGRADAREIEDGDAVEKVAHPTTGQKFFGRPSARRAMMFFCTSDVPPPIVSITV